MWAVTSKAGLPLVQLLLDRGASTSFEDSNQATALTVIIMHAFFPTGFGFLACQRVFLTEKG